MDTFVTPGEACHPSDNVGGILVAASLANASGRDFVAALALAYEVQRRLTNSGVPVMKAGFDHTVTQAISLACGIARVLHLSREQVTNAIAIATVGGAGLAASRTGAHLSKWKGFASAEMALLVMHSVLLGAQGIIGPTHVFEGPLG
jgi:2-methylcitrate dehydratase